MNAYQSGVESTSTGNHELAAWVTPVVSRMSAGDAELGGSTAEDGPIGQS